MDQISRAESWITSGAADLDKFHETQSRGTNFLYSIFPSAVENKKQRRDIDEGHTHTHTLHTFMLINSPDVRE